MVDNAMTKRRDGDAQVPPPPVQSAPERIERIERALWALRPPWWWRLGRTTYLVLLAGVFALLLGVWELVTAGLGLVNPVFLPPPSDIGSALVAQFTTGEIYPYLTYSAVEWIIGYSAAAAVGVLVGWAMGSFVSVGRLVGPYAWLVAAAPWVAFQPIYTVWFGFGQFSVIMLVFTASLTTVIFNTAVGVSNVEMSWKHAAKVFGANPVQMLWKVVIPGAGPFVLLGLRYSLVGSMLAVLIAEIAGSTNGLGGLVTYKTSTFDTDTVYGILLLPVVVTVVLGGLMQALAKRLSGETIR